MTRTHFSLSIIYFATIYILSGCGESRNKQINDNAIDSTFIKSLTEKRVGETEYYISLPPNFSIRETEGPDFSVYYFYLTDTTLKPNFGGGLYFG